MSVQTKDRQGLWAALGSIFAAVLASACCWLPLLLIAFGASAAGISSTFERYRPLMLGVTATLLATGFYLVYFRKEHCAPDSTCATPNPKLKRLNRALLWIATLAVATFAFFPNYAVLFTRDTSQLPAAVEDAPTVSLTIEGMTCEACASHIQEALMNVPGVLAASINYDEATATIAVDSATPPGTEALIRAVEAAGYSARSDFAIDRGST